EKVTLNYKSISWNHITAGTSAYSIWEDRVL
ncbi:type VI secretion system tube protein Hcp, partial [Xenorhabdus griffiniae]|nr:type VI secretion system tube protein Hcp [Xenorhabdus griffiniae]